jgi:hypothetical protein
MTTDKLTNALISLMTSVAPSGVAVADARAQEEKILPQIAVSVEQPDRHSAAMPGVQKCPVKITLEAHPGDGVTRETLTAWGNAIEKALNDPNAVKASINASGQGLQCDFWAYEGGSPGWDESTFQAEFNAEAWVVRTA